MERFYDIFTNYPSFRCEDIAEKANDFSKTDTAPLTFAQFDFWIYFAIVYLMFAFVHNRIMVRNLFLLLVSVFFYFKTSGFFIIILIFSTLIDYYIGNAIHKSDNKRKRLSLLVLSMFMNLFVLCFFKYAYFFTASYNEVMGTFNEHLGTAFNTDIKAFNYFGYWYDSFWDTDYFCVDKIILPVGISFYTFQTMSYSLDIYRKELTPVKSLVDFSFFVTFFPQLVAGPIVRAKDFIPQMYQPFRLTHNEAGVAVFTIMRGLVKKIVVADFISGNFLSTVIANFENGTPDNIPGYVCVLAMWAYSIGIYCDFSGYTDIAIGLSKLMGFDLMINFNSPYKAKNVAEFWKRWHISLSTWLRDYLYIPLGGNRKGTVASYILLFFIYLLISLTFQRWTGMEWFMILFWLTGVSVILALTGYVFKSFGKFMTTDMNLMITMVLGGFWHGPTQNFITWGALNGLALVVYKYWKRISPYEKSSFFLVNFWKIFLTFNFISFTRIFFIFQSPDHSDMFLDNIINISDTFSWTAVWDAIWVKYPAVFAVAIVGLIIHWLPYSLKDAIRDWFASLQMHWQAFMVFGCCVFIYQFMSGKFIPFVYFQF
ncbi:MAG: MBOAT family O-acyltransferase [Bacteroidota bacterium]